VQQFVVHGLDELVDIIGVATTECRGMSEAVHCVDRLANG
jgi:hypothetical protein